MKEFDLQRARETVVLLRLREKESGIDYVNDEIMRRALSDALDFTPSNELVLDMMVFYDILKVKDRAAGSLEEKSKSSRPEFTLAEEEHGMNAYADMLFQQRDLFCQMFEMSPWDLMSAYANVSAWTLASYDDLPEDHIMQRINDLREIMIAAYKDRKYGHSGGSSSQH